MNDLDYCVRPKVDPTLRLYIICTLDIGTYNRSLIYHPHFEVMEFNFCVNQLN